MEVPFAQPAPLSLTHSPFRPHTKSFVPGPTLLSLIPAISQLGRSFPFASPPFLLLLELGLAKSHVDGRAEKGVVCVCVRGLPFQWRQVVHPAAGDGGAINQISRPLPPMGRGQQGVWSREGRFPGKRPGKNNRETIPGLVALFSGPLRTSLWASFVSSGEGGEDFLLNPVLLSLPEPLLARVEKRKLSVAGGGPSFGRPEEGFQGGFENVGNDCNDSKL